MAVVTLSEDGSMAITRERRIHVPAAPVETVVDLTGAGDLYAAGFLFGLANGESLEDSARLGSLAAAEVISHVGARPTESLSRRAGQAGLAA
jgi:sugar/nucleoside kinase (ribokinase family)